MQNPNPCPRVPAKIFNQKDKGHCSGYSILAYLYNSYVAVNYDEIDRGMQKIENAMMSVMGGFNHFKRLGILQNLKNLSLDEARERIKNGYPVIVNVPFFGEVGASGLVEQDFSQVMGGHVICAVSMAENKGENVVKFQNSWGENWGENGFGYIKIHKGMSFYMVE